MDDIGPNMQLIVNCAAKGGRNGNSVGRQRKSEFPLQITFEFH